MTRPSPTFVPPAPLDPRAALDALTAEQLEARLRLDEEGLAGLVPVDRILATIGGILGGAIVLGAALAIAGARDAIGLRRRGLTR